MITITYYGHSCFTLKFGDFTLAIDPYDSSISGYKPLCLTAGAVYPSHGHGDHNNTAAVTLHAGHNPFTVSEFASFHDNARGKTYGENTMRLFEANGLRVVHLGDLGHMLSEKDIAQIGRVDALLVPIGGNYTLNADLAARVALQLRPTTLIPMHYKEGKLGLQEIDTPDAFLQKISPYYPVTYANGNTVCLDEQATKPTLVLKYVKGDNHE